MKYLIYSFLLAALLVGCERPSNKVVFTKEAETKKDSPPGRDTSDSDNVDDLTPKNLPPVITDLGTQTAIKGETYTYTIEALDPEGDSLFYSIDPSTLTSGVSLSGKEILFDPINATEGFNDIIVTVFDGINKVNLTISVIVMTKPPLALNPVEDVSIESGESISREITAVDPTEVFQISFAEESPKKYITIEGNTIKIEPPFDVESMTNKRIRLKAADGFVEFKVTVKTLQNKKVRIKNAASDKCLFSSKKSAVGSGFDVFEDACDAGNDEKRWIVQKKGKDDYILINDDNDLCLTASQLHVAFGTTLNIFTKNCSEGKNQHFKMKMFKDKTEIESFDYNTCITSSDGAKMNSEKKGQIFQDSCDDKGTTNFIIKVI